MTDVRAAGQGPAAPTSQSLYVSRGAAFAAAGVLAALNAQADQIIADLSWQSPIDALLNLGGVSALMWAAMFAAWSIGGEGHRALRGGLDMAVLGLVVLLSFVPLSYSAQVGLLLCGMYLLLTADGSNDAERRAAIVLLALTGPLIWGRLLLRLFEAPILAVDAHLVGAAIGTTVQGNIVHFPDGSGRFVVGDPCSSVHNMSLAIVLWTTSAMLFRIRMDRSYVMIGIAMCSLMFVLNIVRLSMLGLFPTHFDYWHTGGGAVLFAWAGLIGATLLAGFGITNAAARQH